MVGVDISQSVVICWSVRATAIFCLFVCYTNEHFSCGWQEDEHGKVTRWKFCIKAKIVRREANTYQLQLLLSANLSMFHRW